MTIRTDGQYKSTNLLHHVFIVTNLLDW